MTQAGNRVHIPGTNGRADKFVIEIAGPGGQKQWLDATPENARRFNVPMTEVSPTAAQAFGERKTETKQIEDALALAQKGKEIELGIKRDESAARIRSSDATISLEQGRLGLERQIRTDNHTIALGTLGVAQKNADTTATATAANIENAKDRLALDKQQLLQQGQQFSDSNLLARQQAAMNYNLGVHTLNERSDNAAQERRRDLFAGIGAAIAALIGGSSNA